MKANLGPGHPLPREYAHSRERRNMSRPPAFAKISPYGAPESRSKTYHLRNG